MKELALQVQHNCHISDAQYAGNYTLCIYLLKMREFYRWESQLPLTKTLSKDDIGQWLVQREAHWDDIDELPLSDLQINGQTCNVFDSETINTLLESDNLIYSGGYGLYGKPVFFLGELLHKEKQDDYTLYITGKELARDLAAPPGMAQNKTVYIRRESLRRFIWEKVEESDWHTQENALSRALDCYNFKDNQLAALEKMTDNEVNTVLHHEIGEIQAGKILGDIWEEMLMDLPPSQGEIMARAVRDNIADMLSTLPELIKRNEPAQLNFYFANMSSMRKVIFPGLMSAYTHWLESHDTSKLSEIIPPARDHWIKMAEQMINLYKQHNKSAHTHMENLINNNAF